MKKFGIAFFFILAWAFPASAHADKIVDTNTTYTYEQMQGDLKQLDQEYGDLVEVYDIGDSVYDRDIFLVKLGYGEDHVLYNGSHHAREWLTTILNMNMIEEYAKGYQGETSFPTYNAKQVLDGTTIWFVPMVNPDGVTLQQKGLSAFPEEVHSQLIQWNNGSTNFKRWKANAQGIDLNRQYPSGWENVTKTSRSYKNFKGDYPLQAPEAKVMRDLQYLLNPELTISYHTAGQIMYWNYKIEPENYDRDSRIARNYSRFSGYDLVNFESNGSGYTDWVIDYWDQPALTPELAVYPGPTNVDPARFPTAWENNKVAGLYAAREGYVIADRDYRDPAEIWLDNRTEQLLADSGAENYTQVLAMDERFRLHPIQMMQLYSWYQSCENCSPETLNEELEGLKAFQEWEENKTVPSDHVFTVRFNTSLTSDSLNEQSFYVQTESGQQVELSAVQGGGDRVLLYPPNGGYESGETYSMFIKEVTSTENYEMEGGIEFTFDVE
ncbi:M14 family zinc carboxypeptidase [Salimicrobium halophilum]|uniref:G-D-glutamyl-meso-diaminopimelate peptidase n=1 Tax=Salimicrobium halophilum TaxID=86666 RepID=A0A1G8S2X6_9BACI|nr:M14 family zinc carboxypeptidase [Salimicrobium halophilum]SDJ23125.1 g-D-glutamyl-meso-diaminopimelate peptidase [Salimicrobium halophilum]